MHIGSNSPIFEDIKAAHLLIFYKNDMLSTNSVFEIRRTEYKNVFDLTKIHSQLTCEVFCVRFSCTDNTRYSLSAPPILSVQWMHFINMNRISLLRLGLNWQGLVGSLFWFYPPPNFAMLMHQAPTTVKC